MSRVDKNQRPAHLADVIVGIVAEPGLDAVSVREVAARAVGAPADRRHATDVAARLRGGDGAARVDGRCVGSSWWVRDERLRHP